MMVQEKDLARRSGQMTTEDSVRQWSIRRIDMRSPLVPQAWPVIRVELDHPERGRITDIASAPGAFDAAFLAVSQIVGLNPRLLAFNVRSISPTADSLSISVEVQLEMDGRLHVGRSVGLDLVRCAVEAWLSAAAGATAGEEIPAYMRRCRPFQVTGVDCNDNLWIFASSDEGAAEAIATEFADEHYDDIAILR